MGIFNLFKSKTPEAPAGNNDNQMIIEQPSKSRPALTTVPMTPRYVPRTMGGAVRKDSMGRPGFRGFSFDLLRMLAYQSPLLEAIISARLHGVKHFAKRYKGGKDGIGFRVVHEDEHDHEVDVKKFYPDAAERCKRWERLFNTPHPLYCPSFSDFCLKLTSDILEINRPAVEMLFDIESESVLMQFQPVDGALILPTLNYLEQFRAEHPGESGWSRDPVDQLFQIFWNAKRMDLSGYEYVVVREGTVENCYKPGRLILCPMNTVTNVNFAGFPPSLLERAVIGVMAFDNAFSYNSTYFTKGNMVETILGISADFDDKSFLAFQQQLRDNFTGVSGAYDLPIVRLEDAKDLQAIRIKENNRDMQYMEFINTLVSLVTAVFRMHPSNINFIGRGSDGKALFDRNQEYEVASSVEEGQHSLLDHIVLICNQIIHQTDPDLEMELVGLNHKDAEKEARIVETELRSWRSIDSVLQERGDKPYKQWWSECPANPAILPYVAQQHQPQVDPAKAMAQGGPGQGDAGQGGPAQGGFGQEDFGKEQPGQDEAKPESQQKPAEMDTYIKPEAMRKALGNSPLPAVQPLAIILIEEDQTQCEL